ncbi:MAG: twin-arginine translocation signal domain-containing protein [Lachnospiraceae bacterium]|nr:twin-arginine translocation signal domain-containing protein [Lachnospiraceae bacterium]
MLGRNSGKISRRDFLKGVTAGAVSTSLACLFPLGVLASEGTEKDWGEYSIENDGYGYMTDNFAAEYP